MSIHTREIPNSKYTIVVNDQNHDAEWLLDDGKTHVVIVQEAREPGWWIINRGMKVKEGPFSTPEEAAVYCNLRYTRTKSFLS